MQDKGDENQSIIVEQVAFTEHPAVLAEYYYFHIMNTACPVSHHDIAAFLCCLYGSAQRPVRVCVAT